MQTQLTDNPLAGMFDVYLQMTGGTGHVSSSLSAISLSPEEQAAWNKLQGFPSEASVGKVKNRSTARIK